LNYPPKGVERLGPRGVNSEAARRRQVPGAREGAPRQDASAAPCLLRAID